MSPRTSPHTNYTWIADNWHKLAALHHKGTPLPWKEPTITPEQRARMDAEARAEKLERGAGAFGESPAPVHLAALQRTIDLTQQLQTLVRATRPQLVPGDLIHPQAHPEHLAHWLGWAVTQADRLPIPLEQELDTASRHIRGTIERAISPTVNGQRLKAACPWCRQENLRIRVTHSNSHPLVVCESGVCEPPPSDCGTWWHGKPAWPWHDWEFLVARIDRQTHRDTPPTRVAPGLSTGVR